MYDRILLSLATSRTGTPESVWQCDFFFLSMVQAVGFQQRRGWEFSFQKPAVKSCSTEEIPNFCESDGRGHNKHLHTGIVRGRSRLGEDRRCLRLAPRKALMRFRLLTSRLVRKVEERESGSAGPEATIRLGFYERDRTGQSENHSLWYRRVAGRIRSNWNGRLTNSDGCMPSLSTNDTSGTIWHLARLVD